MNLFATVSYGLDGIAHACETLVEQALGRRDLKEARAPVWLALKPAFGGAVASTAIFWAFGPELIALLTDIDHVATTGEAALPWLIALPYWPPEPLFLMGYLLAPRRAQRCAIPCWRLRF